LRAQPRLLWLHAQSLLLPRRLDKLRGRHLILYGNSRCGRGQLPSRILRHRREACPARANLRARVPVVQRKAALLTEGREGQLSHSPERNIAGASVSRNGAAGQEYPVPTSRFIRTQQLPSRRRVVPCPSGVRASRVPCTPHRRDRPQAGNPLLEWRRLAVRSMAVSNNR
jgi:hypothetical protein